MKNSAGVSSLVRLGFSLAVVAALGRSAQGVEHVTLGEQLALALGDQSWSGSCEPLSHSSSDNFCIVTAGTAICDARQLAANCEKCLTLLHNAWRPHVARLAWSPKCIVVVHRTPESYDQAVGANGGASWGSARVTRAGGRITRRQIDLCAPTLRRLVETLPHELTHVLLADDFPAEAVPRWLDEGAAVLAEPPAKVEIRLRAASSSNSEALLFRTAELFHAESYPSGPQQTQFYAESYGLTRLLLARGGPARLTEFAQSGCRRGYETALREHYGLHGFAQLDELRQTASATAGLIAQASRERNESTIALSSHSSKQPTLRLISSSYHRATAIPPKRGN